MNSQIKYRSMPIQVILVIVTLGIYCLYWFYQTAVELKDASGDTDASPALWLILLFVPFGALYSHYKYAEVYEKWSSDHFNKWLLWVIYFIFTPAVWFIVQTELNKRATYGW